MARPRMVAMAMGDHGARHRPRPDRCRSRPARSRGRAASDRARPGDRGSFRVSVAIGTRMHPSPSRYGSSRPVCTLVRKPRLDAAAAPARAGRARPAGQERAADRADRRRQDAGRLPAVADRAHRAPPQGRGPGPRQGQGRAAHALHLAAQGAGDRHPAQSRDADRRDGAADAGRDPDRRHAAEPPPAPARAAARPADDHAGIAGAAAVLPRCARSSSPA